MSEESGIDEEQLKLSGDSLLKSWNAQGGATFMAGRRGRRAWTQHQFIAVHSLAAHVHRLYVPATRLLDEGWVIEALPLIRAAYEMALTAHWIAQVDDGANAFMNEDVRQRRGLEQTAQLGLSAEVLAGGSVHGIDLDPLETSAAGSARNFEQLCRDLTPGGANAYFHYRALSMYSHPSVALVDEYLQPDASGNFVGLRISAKERDAAPWRGLLVAALLWAGRAVDYFDMSHVRRSELRAVARELGIAGELHPTPGARLRLAEQSRKRT